MTNQNSNEGNAFTYRGEYYYEEDGKYWKLKFGTRRMSVSKKDFYKLKEKANESI